MERGADRVEEGWDNTKRDVNRTADHIENRVENNWDNAKENVEESADKVERKAKKVERDIKD